MESKLVDEESPGVRRFLSFVTVDETNGCWVWTGGLSSYRTRPAFYAGMVKGKPQIVSARHWIYERSSCAETRPIQGVGTARDGLAPACGTDLCVNPSHMQVISCTRYMNDFELLQRHYSYNQETGCWEWVGALTGVGYGHVNRGRRGGQVLVHRLAYELFVGPIPSGHIICHRCDNPKCFNPGHLFLGDDKDNHEDAMAKGRKVVGRKGMNSLEKRRWTWEEAVMIRSRFAAGERIKDLAEEYHVSYLTVRNLVKGKSYKTRNGRLVLTSEQVREIASKLDLGATEASLAREYGVSPGTINHVKHRRRWKALLEEKEATGDIRLGESGRAA